MTAFLTCTHCHRPGNLDDFCRGKNGIPLGLDNFRCPTCGYEFHRFHMPPYLSKKGDVLPGKIDIRPGHLPGGYEPVGTLDFGRWKRTMKEKYARTVA